MEALGEIAAKRHGQLERLSSVTEVCLAFRRQVVHLVERPHVRDHAVATLVAVRTADVTPGPDVSLQVTDCYKVEGPALVELQGATCWVPAGWHGETNDEGTWVLRR